MNRQKIVLVCIHSAVSDEAVPLGAACVASALRTAFEKDGQKLPLVILEAYASDSETALAKRIQSEQASFVGFSLYSWNRTLSVRTAAAVRSAFPAAFLFCGGPEASSNDTALLKQDGGPFDVVIKGEGESASVSLFSSVFENSEDQFPPVQGCIHSTVEKSDMLSSPWLDATLDLKRYKTVLWELARACPYACTYCYESKGLRKLRYLDEARILSELKLFASSGTEAVFVLDPTFNADRGRAVRLLELFVREAPHIHWHFEVRAEALDRQQAKLFAALSSSLQIGLQTADPAVSEGLGRKLDIKLFTRNIGFLNQAGAVFGLDLMYGLPGDSLDGYKRSLDYALSLYPNNLAMFRLSVLPGTILADQAADLGLKHDAEAPYLIQSTPKFSAQDLAQAEQLSEAADLFYNRGRAVAWFNQVLHPLRMSASAFLERFAGFIKGRNMQAFSSAADKSSGQASDPVALERLQLEFLDELYEKAGLEYLLPAVWDIVRFHAAWARAIAEGISTDIAFNYDPDELLGRGAVDLDQFVSFADFSPCTVVVQAGPGEPQVSVKG